MGGGTEEIVFMLMLILEVIHFPMAKIRKPFKSYLPFSLKKKKKKRKHHVWRSPLTGMKNAQALFLLILWAGIVIEGEAFAVKQKEEEVSKQNNMLCYYLRENLLSAFN